MPTPVELWGPNERPLDIQNYCVFLWRRQKRPVAIDASLIWWKGSPDGGANHVDHSMDQVNTWVERTRKLCAHILCVEGRYKQGRKLKRIESRTQIDVRYLTMKSQKKRSVFNAVKVQAVEPTCEIESTDERALICKQRPVYKINCLCVFLKM